MRALLDSDLLHKLALFKLLEPFVQCLKSAGCTLHALGTFRFRYHLNDPVKALENCYTAGAVASLRKFVSENGGVPLVEGSPLYGELASIPEIDVGELQLVVAAIHDKDAIIYTSDKRFLQALKRDHRLATQRHALQGRIVVLEQVLLGFLGQLPFADLKVRIVPALKHDTMMRAIFGSGEQSTLDSVARAVTAYVNDAQERLAPLLAGSWPVSKP